MVNMMNSPVRFGMKIDFNNIKPDGEKVKKKASKEVDDLFNNLTPEKVDAFKKTVETYDAEQTLDRLEATVANQIGAENLEKFKALVKDPEAVEAAAQDINQRFTNISNVIKENLGESAQQAAEEKIFNPLRGALGLIGGLLASGPLAAPMMNAVAKEKIKEGVKQAGTLLDEKAADFGQKKQNVENLKALLPTVQEKAGKTVDALQKRIFGEGNADLMDLLSQLSGNNNSSSLEDLLKDLNNNNGNTEE